MDAKQDKGIDGILVNDVLEEIYLFQSKIKQKDNAALGDTDLKEFAGTLVQFSTPDNIQAILDGTANAALKSAIVRNEIKEKLSRGYSVEGIFCTNVPMNSDGLAYSDTIKNISVYDSKRIALEYVDADAPVGISEEFTFDISDTEVIQYSTSEGVSSRIFLANALQMTHLKGIADGSLFSLNVRLSLGNTKVNKAILESIRDKKEHKNFPLYHNGITLLCSKFTEKPGSTLVVNDYVVVNGAQSLSSLLRARSSISQDLKVLVKIVALGGEAELGKKITQNSNNQNAIQPRDMRSNNKIQQRLKKEVDDLCYNNYVLEIKRGEITKGRIAISNEKAGLALLAIDLREPWAAHQKYKVMDDSHSKIFGRADVTGEKIVLFTDLISGIEGLLGFFEDSVLGHYALTKYFLAYATAEILGIADVGQEALRRPESIVQSGRAEKFIKIFLSIASTTIADLEAEISELKESGDFDHKRDFKSQRWCKNMANKLAATYKKDVMRKKAASVDDLFGDF